MPYKQASSPGGHIHTSCRTVNPGYFGPWPCPGLPPPRVPPKKGAGAGHYGGGGGSGGARQRWVAGAVAAVHRWEETAGIMQAETFGLCAPKLGRAQTQTAEAP